MASGSTGFAAHWAGSLGQMTHAGHPWLNEEWIIMTGWRRVYHTVRLLQSLVCDAATDTRHQI